MVRQLDARLDRLNKAGINFDLAARFIHSFYVLFDGAGITGADEVIIELCVHRDFIENGQFTVTWLGNPGPILYCFSKDTGNVFRWNTVTKEYNKVPWPEK